MEIMEKEIRVRFAPSPTGPLHIGGVKTALFNYLFAKHNRGKIVLRIEDTDQNRYVEGAEEYIIESLQWLGIDFDESPEKGGDYGPYRQSERKSFYQKYAQKLIDSGKAYYAFDTAEELEQMRKKLEAEKAPNLSYAPHIRMQMRNSLSLTAKATKALLDQGTPYVVRFKMEENQEILLHDIIRGKVSVNTSTLDDKILFKADGMPTYHLANVVDDYLMRISHVIRGEEWLPSLALHQLLYEALGWKDAMPEFAHLPLILKPTGKGKLSKRDGDKMGFPVFPIEWNNPENGDIFPGYREAGYLPEAVVNMLALLGWSPGNEKEFLSLDELINTFDLHKVGKSGSRFNPEKALWYNHHYLQQKSDEDLAHIFRKILLKKNIIKDLDFIVKVVNMVKERANLIPDLWENANFFFEAPQEYDAKLVRKKWKENTASLLQSLIPHLEKITIFSASAIKSTFESYVNKNELGFGAVMLPLRLTIVGSGKGPDLFEIMALLGKKETIGRIHSGINAIQAG
jgi:glutamyl-tRNA synthetase